MRNNPTKPNPLLDAIAKAYADLLGDLDSWDTDELFYQNQAEDFLEVLAELRDWRLVPVEPTGKMLGACQDAVFPPRDLNDGIARDMWVAMLAASGDDPSRTGCTCSPWGYESH